MGTCNDCVYCSHIWKAEDKFNPGEQIEYAECDHPQLAETQVVDEDDPCPKYRKEDR